MERIRRNSSDLSQRETHGKYNDLKVLVPHIASHQIQAGVDLQYTLS